MKPLTTTSRILFLLLFLIPGISLHAQLSGFHLANFEEEQFPPVGWTSQSIIGDAVWERSTDESYDGTASAYMSYDYPDGEDWLISPQFSVNTNDSLIFYLATDFSGYTPDSLVIRVSTTDALIPSFTQSILKYEEGVNYPSSGGVWQRCAVSLTPFAGQDIYIAFSHYNEDGDGIYIDQVTIGQLPVLDARTNTLTSPSRFVIGTNYNPSATVTNMSQTSQDFNVTIEIEGGYISTIPSGSLASLEVTEITFTAYTPTTSGITQGKVYTQLAGDENNLNDTLYFTINVLDTFPNYGWQAQTSLPTPIWGGASAFLKSCEGDTDTGYLYSIAGNDGAGTTLSTVYRYNTTTDTWTSVSNLPATKQQLSAAVIQNKIYVPGGYTLSFSPSVSSHVYDPATDTWSPIADLLQATGDYAIGTYADSLLYIVGGYDGSVDIADVQIYNVNTDSWATGTPFPGTLSAGLRMGIADGTIVLVGGYNQDLGQQDQAWIGEIDNNDPYSITWTQLSDGYPAGTTGRFAAGTSTMNDGKVYFTSGDPDGNGSSALSSTYAYNVRTQQWEGGPAKLTGVSNVSNFTPYIQNDSLYMAVLGGYDGVNFASAFESINLGRYTTTTNDALIVTSETTICEGESIDLSISTQNMDGLTWSPSSLFTDPTVGNSTITPSEDVRIKLNQVTYYGCPILDSIDITVHPIPDVTLTAAFESICDYNAPITLTEGTPSGGVYSGPGITGDSFDPSVAGAGTHTIVYTYTDGNGCSNSTDAPITVSECLGINDPELAGINVYPNPASDFIMVNADMTIEKIEIYQMNGSIVMRTDSASLSTKVNLDTLSPGLYMLHIYVEGKIYPYKISKQ